MKPSAAMQISAANLLIASQQGAKAAARSDGAFATALAKEKTDFEPLAFKQVAALERMPFTPPAPPAPGPVGSQVDIRV